MWTEIILFLGRIIDVIRVDGREVRGKAFNFFIYSGRISENYRIVFLVISRIKIKSIGCISDSYVKRDKL